MPPEGNRLGRRRAAGERSAVDPARVRVVERIGARVGVAMIGGGRPVRDEEPPALLECRDVPGVVAGVDAGRLGELGNRPGPT